MSMIQDERRSTASGLMGGLLLVFVMLDIVHQRFPTVVFAHATLIAATSLVSDSLASPNSMIVLGS